MSVWIPALAPYHVQAPHQTRQPVAPQAAQTESHGQAWLPAALQVTCQLITECSHEQVGPAKVVYWGRQLARCCCAVLALESAASSAEKLGVALDYRVEPSECASEEMFRSQVAELLEYDPFAAPPSRTVTVTISSADQGLVGLLEWRDRQDAPEGQRRFETLDGDCVELTKNMVFAVVVQIQLMNAPPEEPPEEEPVAAEVAPKVTKQPPAKPIRDSVEPPPPEPSRPLQWLAGAGPLMGFGWSPDPSVGARMFLVTRGQAAALEAAFEATAPSRFERRDGTGFEISVLTGTLTPCLRHTPVEVCSVLRFGQIRARGIGIGEARSPSGFLSQAGFRLSFVQSFGSRVETALHAEALRTLTPWTIELNETEAFSLPPFGFMVGIDLMASIL